MPLFFRSGRAIMADSFEPEKRGQAFALYGLVAVLAPSLGPTKRVSGRDLWSHGLSAAARLAGCARQSPHEGSTMAKRVCNHRAISSFADHEFDGSIFALRLLPLCVMPASAKSMAESSIL
jgi:hypothetical protein